MMPVSPGRQYNVRRRQLLSSHLISIAALILFICIILRTASVWTISSSLRMLSSTFSMWINNFCTRWEVRHANLWNRSDSWLWNTLLLDPSEFESGCSLDFLRGLFVRFGYWLVRRLSSIRCHTFSECSSRPCVPSVSEPGFDVFLQSWVVFQLVLARAPSRPIAPV